MNFLISSAWRELRNNHRFSFFFLFNLTLGLLGFIILISFGESIKSSLSNNLKNILTADLQVFTRTPLSPEEQDLILKKLPRNSERSEQITFFSMASSESHSRLAEIIAIDRNFPLYGNFLLESGPASPNKIDNILQNQFNVWMHTETRELFQLNQGDEISVGEQKYRLGEDILEDPPGMNGMSNFAPKIYMGKNKVDATGLIQLGSRINYRSFFRFDSPENKPSQIAQNMRESFQTLEKKNKSLRVRSYLETGDRVVNLLEYILGYLGLIAIVALFLAGIASSYLFRSYIGKRLIDVAIFRSLGASRFQSALIPLFQLIFLGVFASFIASGIAAVFLPLTSEFLIDLFPAGAINLQVRLHVESLFVVFWIAVLGSIFFCLPAIFAMNGVSPVDLFREAQAKIPEKSKNLMLLLTYLPSIFFFWGLAVWQTDWKIGSLFSGFFFLSLIFFALLAWSFFWICGKLKPKNILFKIALRNLNRNRFAAISCFLAIALGSFLINLTPQLLRSVYEEIENPKDSIVPTYFLFDIQPEQADPLIQVVQEQNHEFSNISPMISAFLIEVNGQLPEKYLEGDQEVAQDGRNMSRRRFNLSYRKLLSNTEEIVAGKAIIGDYDPESMKLPMISLEQNFAESNKLKIGDKLIFEVFGIPVEGEVVNLRRVRWNSFQPNFFVSFQTGVLEDFPHTFIGAIPQVAPEEKPALRKAIVKEFPNVSMIDVSRVIRRILEIADKMSIAINVMAYLSIFTGLIVIFSIARSESEKREWEISLLKTLGAGYNDLQKLIILEFGFLSLLSAGSGIFASWPASFYLSQYILQNSPSFSWQTSLMSLLSIVFVAVSVVYLATVKTMKQKPWKILKAV